VVYCTTEESNIDCKCKGIPKDAFWIAWFS